MVFSWVVVSWASSRAVKIPKIVTIRAASFNERGIVKTGVLRGE